MSLVEPLLSKEILEDPQPKVILSSPLANLEKSVKDLFLEYKAFQLDAVCDLESHDSNSYEKMQLYGQSYVSQDILCVISYENSLAIGRADGIIKVFNLESQEQTALKGHTKAVNCIQFLQMSYLVSASDDKSIIVWNIGDYSIFKTFTTQEEVLCLAVTSFHQFFTGSLNEKVVRRWFIYEDNELDPLTGHEDGITCMKCSPNNELLLTGSKDSTMRIWSVFNKTEIGVARINYGTIDQIMITADNSRAIITNGSGQVVLWDLINNQEIGQWYAFASRPLVLDIMQESNQAWLKQGFDTFRIFNFEDNTFKECTLSISTAAYSKRGNLVYYTLQDNSVTMFNISSSQDVITVKNFGSKILKVLVAGKMEQYLVLIMENGKIEIREIFEERSEEVKLKVSCNYNQSFWTSDNKYLIMAEAYKLLVWSLAEEKTVFELESYLVNVSLTEDERYLVFGTEACIRVYSLQDLKEVASIEVAAYTSRFTLSKNSQLVIVGKSNGSLEIFDIEKKAVSYTIVGAEHEISLIEADYSNKYIITADKEQHLTFWSLLQKKPEETLHLDREIFSLKAIKKSQSLLIGLRYTVEIWSIQNRQKIMTYSEDPINILNLLVSNDENYIVFRQNAQIKVWSLEHMKMTEVLNIDSSINHIGLSKNSKYMIIGCDDNYSRLWSFEEKRYIVKIEGLLSKNFTPDSKYLYWNTFNNLIIEGLEKYTCYNSTSPPFVNQAGAADDKILRQRFINFLKNPTKESYDKKFIEKSVYPIGCNLLHWLCVQDRAELLLTALKDGAEISRDNQSMSPLSYALAKRSRRCIDEILNFIINLEDEEKLLQCIHHIHGDIPELFTSQSQTLVPFLELLFRRRADKDIIGFYQVSEELPMSIFSPIPIIDVSTFTIKNNAVDENSAVNENLLQFWGSPLGYNYSVGSDESLLLLKKIDQCENEQIFSTLFVQSIIKEKWDYLWTGILALSIIFWLNLATMVWHLFYPNFYALISFISLNGVLGSYEIMQLAVKPKDYISEIWNLIDWIRILLSFAWAFLDLYDQNAEDLVSAAVLLNFFRGLTYFRVFDFSRSYVRLVLMAASDSLAFLIIFLYSTLAFGVLYASFDKNLSFSGMWTLAYELSMGNFDNDGFSFLQYFCFTLATLINVVLMLNLLVSTLGDTYDKFQTVSAELDSKEMLSLVIEFESILFWARSEKAKAVRQDKLMYLQRCDLFHDTDASDKWQGKIKELSLKIDGVKDGVIGIQKNVGKELKSVEENMRRDFERIIGEKIIKSQTQLEGKIELMRQDWEPKMKGIMETLEAIKLKLEAQSKLS